MSPTAKKTKSAKSTSKTGGFSAEEKAAMRARARELKAHEERKNAASKQRGAAGKSATGKRKTKSKPKSKTRSAKRK